MLFHSCWVAADIHHRIGSQVVSSYQLIIQHFPDRCYRSETEVAVS